MKIQVAWARGSVSVGSVRAVHVSVGSVSVGSVSVGSVHRVASGTDTVPCRSCRVQLALVSTPALGRRPALLDLGRSG